MAFQPCAELCCLPHDIGLHKRALHSTARRNETVVERASRLMGGNGILNCIWKNDDLDRGAVLAEKGWLGIEGGRQQGAAAEGDSCNGR